MATFIATYLGPTGQQRTVTVKAAGIAAAKKQLRRRGIRTTELRTATEPSNSKGSHAEHGASGALGFDLSRALEKTPGVKEKAIFASKLAALVDAGVPIVRSLDLMATQQKLPMFKRALIKVSLVQQ